MPNSFLTDDVTYYNISTSYQAMTLSQTIRLLLVVLLVGVASLTSVANGFNVGNDARRRVQVVSTTSSSLRMTILSYGGKKKNFKPGTPLSKALPQIGLKPKYSCKK